MAMPADVLRIALSLNGTKEAPHFERMSFKIERICSPLHMMATLLVVGVMEPSAMAMAEAAMKLEGLVRTGVIAAMALGFLPVAEGFRMIARESGYG
ncbi:MAG: hypothetical protein KDJ37_00040 [Hyphomicrobiaceae bacterium]|nr:hypothetical protein [Hyphomicrobiaceae bacterium]